MKKPAGLPAFADTQEYPLGAKSETVWAVIFSSVVFFFPLAVGQDSIPAQFATGIVVNLFLFLAALNLRGWKPLIVLLLPAFAVIDRSLVLHHWASLPLQFMILPFVWAANALLVFLVKYLYLYRKKNKWLVLCASCAAKALFLFAVATVFTALKAAPPAFTTAMGLFQFYTALAGCFFAIVFQVIYHKMIIR